MRVSVLAGGHGGARFTRGLRDVAADDGTPHEITVIGNTADDIQLHGLRISPDLDTIMYTLGSGLDEERGWGRSDEAFRVNEELRAYGLPNTWFGLGDRDLATHLVRTGMLAAGYPLNEVTAALCARWNPGVLLLPMTNDRVETHVRVRDPQARAMHFQEWWIRHSADIPAEGFAYVGADSATAGPGVVESIVSADLVILAPSNPVVSIGAILSVPGIAEALEQTAAPVVGVSPIISGAPVRGMADRCLEAIGVPATAGDVARHYGRRRDGGVLDPWLVDTADEEHASALREEGWLVAERPLLMYDVVESAKIAAAAIDLGDRVRS
ncbi:MAG: 2-phospho-L-lactate transferase [Candidatus Nanopelagicales bacterium]|nr:2-phospho-L-lactate transferase [Candidatus Nanopelagicales bacterium]